MNKKLSLEIRRRNGWPVFAFGFINTWTEFVCLLWFIEFRLKWGY